MSVEYIYKDFKSILNKMKFIDNWFWCRYTLNPYNGCEFACTYCDSRSHKYHLHPDFDQQILVKINVSEMLDNRLRRARTLLPDVVAIGGTCDSYQPAEAEFHNTRKCLEVLLKHHYPVFLSTKSTLVLSDLDLLVQIADDTCCTVAVTVTTTDSEMARFLEPNAPDPASRLEVIRTIKSRAPQIQVGVNLIPIVPFLTDSEESIEAVVWRTKESGADFILFGGGMTMRDNQASWFLSKLSERFPHMIERYEQLYQGKYSTDAGYTGRYEPTGSFYSRINNHILAMCKKHEINFRIKRFIPDDFRRWNYTIAEILLDESYLMMIQGKPSTILFWAGQNIQNLTESIVDVAARGELRTIRNVGPALEQRILKWLKEDAFDCS
ncbi:MAG: radical SAM protein [Chloroflexota bacterium]|nr:radical SAM protein [Chloroflexota bacterium]